MLKIFYSNYDLRTICEKHLNLKNLPEIKTNNILINLQSVNDIKHIFMKKKITQIKK